MHLSVDGKHRVNDRGWLSINTLIKDVPRWTHLSHGKLKPIQGKATTTRAMPVLQALLQGETIPNIVAVCRYLVQQWSDLKPRLLRCQPCEAGHKDFADSIEAARKEVFPLSRPVNEYFHLREKDLTIASKCVIMDFGGGKHVKQKFDCIMYTLTHTQFAPHPRVFSFIWQGFLQLLVVEGETVVAQYLIKEYGEIINADACHFPAFPTILDFAEKEDLWFVSHRTGLWCMYPGTGCGNQPGESLHGRWQRALWAQEEKPTLDSIFSIMNDIYKNTWSRTLDCNSDTSIGVETQILNEKLLNGTLLAAVGRTPALDFAVAAAANRRVHLIRAVAPNVGVIAMSRIATEALDEVMAIMGIDLLFKDNTPMLEQLLASGILAPCGQLDAKILADLSSIKWPHNLDKKGEALLFNNSIFNKIMFNIVYVVD